MSLGRQRFSIIPAEAVTDPSLEGRDLQVLALLGRHTDNRGWCCRSQVKMAREINCGRATVQRSIGRLVEAGYLEHRAIVRDNGGDAAHEYRVVFDRPDDADDGVPTGRQGGAHQWAGVPT
ncbi:MAG: helix-turn-helix domain-containing protein, partial [Mesorhizobium sp.]